jgi:hypothetical protein
VGARAQATRSGPRAAPSREAGAEATGARGIPGAAPSREAGTGDTGTHGGPRAASSREVGTEASGHAGTRAFLILCLDLELVCGGYPVLKVPIVAPGPTSGEVVNPRVGSTSFPCAAFLSLVRWDFRAAPLVVTAVVVARQQAVEASQQAAVWQVTAVAPQRVVEEVASLAVPTPLRPPARANMRVSFLMMMRYHPMRMSLCRSGCSNFPALGQPCPMRQP